MTIGSRLASPRDIFCHLRHELSIREKEYDRARTGDKLIHHMSFSGLIFFPAESCCKFHGFPVLLLCFSVGVVMPTIFIYSLATGEFPSPPPVS